MTIACTLLFVKSPKKKKAVKHCSDVSYQYYLGARGRYYRGVKDAISFARIIPLGIYEKVFLLPGRTGGTLSITNKRMITYRPNASITAYLRYYPLTVFPIRYG
jgi:hypothetical protein